ncbi:uncharacterized protein EV422DRAFT_570110 [Fimicolochytrium jonesii]|uniref:uncharacterized protein n=1 Tax=Fimicolochytrium jonesii TaxID=1396493 RepID=UPI0022FE527A|nr:uncharacterized protein EV422DRAFT_570110 [Fimicolochytrium jonesii]KAI8817959.1 hypothetical protein EV422DRAFT_570110 [Fimicolochytrium jonesii]
MNGYAGNPVFTRTRSKMAMRGAGADSDSEPDDDPAPESEQSSVNVTPAKTHTHGGLVFAGLADSEPPNFQLEALNACMASISLDGARGKACVQGTLEVLEFDYMTPILPSLEDLQSFQQEQEEFVTECDYYPSDDEEEDGVPPPPKDWRLRARKTYKELLDGHNHAAHAQNFNIPVEQHVVTAIQTQPVAGFPHWMARMSQYDPKGRRFVDLGPVLVYAHPTYPSQICAVQIFGAKQTVLNWRVPEHFQRYVHFGRRPHEITFSTVGHNATGLAFGGSIYIPIAAIYPGIPVKENITVQSHVDKVITTQDRSIRTIKFSFEEMYDWEAPPTYDLPPPPPPRHQKSPAALQAFCTEKVKLPHLLPHVAPQMIEVTSPYADSPAFIDRLARSGFVYTPKEPPFKETTCVHCWAVVSQWENDLVDVDAIHRSMPAATKWKCPFAFGE